MSEHEELKVNFEKLEREHSTLKEYLSAMTEDNDAIQKCKDKLLHLRNGVKTMLNELLSTETALLAIMQEHEKLEVNFEELKKECSTFDDNLNVTREKCDALQRSKNLLLDTFCPMHKKRKRKSKQEVKEGMEDEIIEQGKRINDNSNSSVPAICYKCEMICEKYSLQENNESVNDEGIAPMGEMSVHKDNSSRKLKNNISIDRN
jgi:hypothetical protein